MWCVCVHSGKQIHTETGQRVFFCKKGQNTSWWQFSIFVIVEVCFAFVFRVCRSLEETCPFVSLTLLATELLGSLKYVCDR